MEIVKQFYVARDYVICANKSKRLRVSKRSGKYCRTNLRPTSGPPVVPEARKEMQETFQA